MKRRTRRKFRRTVRYAGLIGGVIMLLVVISLGVLQLTGNFHTVVAGQVYRSAQVRPNDLYDYARTYGIRSVINLRGENVGSNWYDDELNTAQSLGLKHYDFRMSASRKLGKDEALDLIALMRDVPKPVLIHCRGGADRTGLASALYMAAIAGGSEWQSEQQLWLTYGHVPLWFTGPYAMNETFEALEPYLGFAGS